MNHVVSFRRTDSAKKAGRDAADAAAGGASVDDSEGQRESFRRPRDALLQVSGMGREEGSLSEGRSEVYVKVVYTI